MSQNKHTPGPWFVDHKSPFLVRAHDDIDGRHIAHVGPANYTPRFDVDEPNAHLIAAAPDLMEALRQITREYRRLRSDEMSFDDTADIVCVEAALKAIAKARGEQP